MRASWPHPLLLLALLATVPATLSAVTLDQVVAMSKAGVSDTVILEMIARDNALVTVAPDQVVTLQRAGVSEAVILALLKSGLPDEPPRTPVDSAPPLPTVPTVAFVGHGPDRPNATVLDISAPPRVVVVPVPVPYAVERAPRRRARAVEVSPPPLPERTANPMLCVERVSVSPSPFAPALTRVTECPAIMQQRYLR
jgi:hypothetical protein